MSAGMHPGSALLFGLLACAPRAVQVPPAPLAAQFGPAFKDREAAIHDPRGELLASGARRTIVVFRVHRDGTVSDVAVREASGVPYVDDVALDTVQRIVLITPPPPAELFQDDSEFAELPLTFTLQAAAFSKGIPPADNRGF